MINRLGWILLLFVSLLSFGQTVQVEGTIIGSSERHPVEYASVLAKDIDGSVKSYTYTNNKGQYKILINDVQGVTLTFSSFGFDTQVIEVDKYVSENKAIVDIVLVDKPIELNEVIVNASQSIFERGDTITFRTKSFTDGTEVTVEDLLKKIPGLNVDNEGTIKVGNQEVERLLIDGDDFFSKGYKVLSKNMPAYSIKEVDILKRYSDNSLLKGIEKSDKVALNLKMDAEYKRVWFGNLEANVGNKHYHLYRGNLMNFGHRSKYYFLTNFNNIGYDAVGDFEQQGYASGKDNPGAIGDSEYVGQSISLSTDVLQFSQQRTNFNNAQLVSLNTLFNVTDNLNIMAQAYLNRDKLSFYRNHINEVRLHNVAFTNRENFESLSKKSAEFYRLSLEYKITPTQTLEATTNFRDGNWNDNSDLNFNQIETNESLVSSKYSLDQSLIYTNRLRNKTVFVVNGRYKQEHIKQRYGNNRVFFADLFTDVDSITHAAQTIGNRMEYAGVNAVLLGRRSNDDVFELQLGNEWRKDWFVSQLNLWDEDEQIIPEGYINNTQYRVNNLYLKNKYNKKANQLNLSASLNFHQLFNQLEVEGRTKSQTPFYINPQVGLAWEITPRHSLLSSYSHNTANAGVLDLHNGYVLQSSRTFHRGVAEFNQLNLSTVLLSYQFGNWADRFLANVMIFYMKNHDYFATDNIITPNYTASERIVVKDKETFNISTQLDYFIKPLSSNIKLSFNYTDGSYANVVNSSSLRHISFANYSAGVEFRSVFNGFFNFHAGVKWMNRGVKITTKRSHTDLFNFLDLTFVFKKRLNIQVKSEHYYYGNLDTDQHYFFLDFNTRYQFKGDKVSLGVKGNNLFDNDRFKVYSISDTGSSIIAYGLLPRHILLSVSYRF